MTGPTGLGASSCELSWEALTYFPTCATAAIGDPRLMDDEAWRLRATPFLRVRRSGYGMLYGLAETDGLPIEVGRRDGVTAVARMESTNDLAELEAAGEGGWVSLGRLRIGDRGAIAACIERADVSTVEVPLSAGWYSAETFRTNDDDLGIRLVAESV